MLHLALFHFLSLSLSLWHLQNARRQASYFIPSASSYSQGSIKCVNPIYFFYVDCAGDANSSSLGLAILRVSLENAVLFESFLRKMVGDIFCAEKECQKRARERKMARLNLGIKPEVKVMTSFCIFHVTMAFFFNIDEQKSTTKSVNLQIQSRVTFFLK